MTHSREIKFVTREGERRSTNTRETVIIVYAESTVRCCPTQGKWTTDETSFRVWDTTGTGNWQLGHLGQCGNCGQIIQPTALILPEPAYSEVDAWLTMSRCDWCGIDAAPVRVSEHELVCELCWEVGLEHASLDSPEWAELPLV